MKHTEGFLVTKEHLDKTWSITSLKTGQTIAKIWDFPEAEANAEFIVRACNSHDGLLQALKTIRDSNESDLEYAQFCEDTAREAINKVEGGLTNENMVDN